MGSEMCIRDRREGSEDKPAGSQQGQQAVGQPPRELHDSTTIDVEARDKSKHCLLYTSPSPRDKRQSRMPSSA
uniref:Uncharacterized protein n=1 Tax=Ralstonia solanacearum TaxID=305 RepID=A0A0S4U212_RALSL|nr:protein of unknown function [Ralstonia solanacearum]